MHFSPVLPQIDGVILVKQGKVRDVYKVDGNYLLVATDRISAFDFILPTEIPGKGQLLTQISNFWFNLFADDMDNHIIETKFDHFPEVLKPYKKELYGRSVLVRQTDVIPFECVARGYLVGSGYKDYQANGSVCGHELPKNIELAAKLDPALFTPATKAEMGDHDENVSIEYMAKDLGDELTTKLEIKTLDLYSKARDYAAQRGIILADTKLEFGLVGDKVLLIDEILPLIHHVFGRLINMRLVRIHQVWINNLCVIILPIVAGIKYQRLQHCPKKFWMEPLKDITESCNSFQGEPWKKHWSFLLRKLNKIF